ncbi:MAG: HlyD family efflux transporter periplasmic adaptor subunit [Acidobacteria bacterium]|nr:HlyD family efflux transporter periplasmic adaptor subunit [Acidobacteriota bacterium]
MSAIINPNPSPVQPQSPAPRPVVAPPPPRRTLNRLIGLLVLGAMAAGAYYFWTQQQEASQLAQKQAAQALLVKTAKAAVGTIERTVRVAGQTSAREFHNITAPRIMGPEGNRPMVLIELAKSGVLVKKDQEIGLIDGQSLQDHVDDLADTIGQAEADMRKRRAELDIEVENMMQNVRQNKASMDKAKLDAGAAELRTSIDQELLKLAAEEAEAQYKASLADIDHKKRGIEADVRILGFTMERHTRHRNRHVGDLRRFHIISPMDGLAVIQTVFRGGEFSQIGQGDQVNAGQLILKVVNPKTMMVEATINQSESGLFRIGQQAEIFLDAFPDARYRGRVHSIGALAVGGFRQNYYIRNIPVKIAVDQIDARFIPDLSASAQILVDKSDNVLKVPKAAVREEAGKQVAYVKNAKGGFDKREIKLGMGNDLEVAVTAGLKDGEEVALNYQVASLN